MGASVMATKEQIAQWGRKYREENRDRLAQKSREYYEANRERLAQQKREYYRANREKIIQSSRDYYEANRERIAQYKREHREREKRVRLVENGASGIPSDQPCWDCKKALGGCSWSLDFTPVEGWIATPTYKAGGTRSDGTRYPPMKSYQIEYCPEFEREPPRAAGAPGETAVSTGRRTSSEAGGCSATSRTELSAAREDEERRATNEHQTDGE